VLQVQQARVLVRVGVAEGALSAGRGCAFHRQGSRQKKHGLFRLYSTAAQHMAWPTTAFTDADAHARTGREVQRHT